LLFFDNEEIQNAALRYERIQSENLNFVVSGFIYSLDLVAYSADTDRTEGLEIQDAWGIEFEGNYVTENTRFNFSHGATI
jgi:hypothetical protein